jgi:SNF2 family DNA or RNA helicase
VIELDPKKFKTAPFAHQLEGVKALLKRPAFALFDEMGAGKSKQVVDAACVLFESGAIDTVVVVAPASCRGVWLDPDLGEIRKHAWAPVRVVEYHAPRKGSHWREVWRHDYRDDLERFGGSRWPRGTLSWVVTNYEFTRKMAKDRRGRNQYPHVDRMVAEIKEHGQKVLLVLDESSFVKSRTAHQSKAIARLRAACARCVLLNGTPVTNSPLDLWSQLRIMDPAALAGFQNFWHFRSRYAIMGGWNNKQVLRFHDLDDLSRRVAPWVLRREKKDCLDLPEKLFTTAEVRLDPATWKKYKELKEEAVLALEEYGEDAQMEANAAVRLLRLSQLTSGILGGVRPPTGAADAETVFAEAAEEPAAMTIDVSREKLDWALEYLSEWTTARAVIVWCRFRRERERLAEELRRDHATKIATFELYGGQPKAEREDAVRRFTTVSSNAKRYMLLAQPHAGGFGLNLVAATEAVYVSQDYSSMIRKQSEDRCHRPGQRFNVTYKDVIATGPQGQKTVDHAIVRALRKYEDVARWTCSEWRKALEE